ncbi:MAG: prolipoprotein diacylglyceryl transferase [Lachnospiraceae bacterium]|nr:prolipoprotein diacylglyceryl transferase [Lachnospiraceae bacterium]MBQ3905370.1 prolipoprotein diacylglyceryl transferase [Lachnospiraceae bacterium]
MYNDLLKIGPLTLHTYGLMIFIGVMAALYVAEYRAPKNGMDKEEIFPLTMYCVVTGILGAKVMFLIVGWKDFIKDPLSMLGSSGLVVYGGIIGGILCAILYCKYKKLSFWDAFDIALPSVAVAQAFGRIGCFMAGCCYGAKTEAWYGIAFTHSDYAPNGVKMIPTQLISSAGMFLIAFLLFWYAYHAKKNGQVGAAYMILYSIGRFSVEFLRGDIARGSVGVLSTSQFISIFIILIGIGLWILRGKNGADRPQALKKNTDEAK